MMVSYTLLLILVVTLCVVYGINTEVKSRDEVRGLVLLDASTFPHIVPSDRHATIVFLWNKANADESVTGLAREEYLEFATQGDQGEARDLLFSQVIVNGAHNSFLSKRLGSDDNAKKPLVLLYKRGASEPIVFPFPKISKNRLRKFASKHTGYYYPAKNNLRQMDKFSQLFIMVSNAVERAKIIEDSKEWLAAQVEASKNNSDLFSNKHREMGEYYIRVMEKIQTDGFEYAEREATRISNILSGGKVTVKDKLKLLEAKLDIVMEFNKDYKMSPDREKPLTIEEREKQRKGATDDAVDIGSLKDSILRSDTDL
jgi:hypothetical protein